MKELCLDLFQNSQNMKALSMMFFLLFLNISFSQKGFDYEKERNKFNLNLINSKKLNGEIVFKIDSTHCFTGKYLGKIKTKSGRELYIITNASWYGTQISPHVYAEICVFNMQKEYLGSYDLGNLFDIPKKIKENKLYLKESDCKNTVIVNLLYGIPRFINLKCNGENEYVWFNKP